MVAKAFVAYALPMVGERVLRKRNRTLSPQQLVDETLALCCVDPSGCRPRSRRRRVAAGRRPQGPEGSREGVPRRRPQPAEAARPAEALPRDHRRRAAADAAHLRGEGPARPGRRPANRAARRRPDWRYEVHPDLGHVPMLEDAGVDGRVDPRLAQPRRRSGSEGRHPHGRLSRRGRLRFPAPLGGTLRSTLLAPRFPVSPTARPRPPPVAQWIERRTSNPRVAGSSPARGTAQELVAYDFNDARLVTCSPHRRGPYLPGLRPPLGSGPSSTAKRSPMLGFVPV